MNIKLKNINLEGVSLLEQLRKVDEEDNEFIEATLSEQRENAIEEFWDCVQARLGLLQKVLNMSADEVMNSYPKHLEKIKDRPRVRRCIK